MGSIYRKYFKTAALMWLACFVLFFSIHMLVLTPQKDSKKQFQKQLDEKKQLYNSALNATQEGTKRKLNEQIERLRDGLGDFVIDFEDSANLTFDISRIANEQGVASFNIKTKDDSRNSGIPDCKYIHENHIDVSFTAGFNRFAALLNALERHRPVIFVDRFEITSAKQNDSGHKMRMGLAVFVRKKQDS